MLNIIIISYLAVNKEEKTITKLSTLKRKKAMAGNLKELFILQYTLFVDEVTFRLHLFKNTLNSFFPNANHSVFFVQYSIVAGY